MEEAYAEYEPSSIALERDGNSGDHRNGNGLRRASDAGVDQSNPSTIGVTDGSTNMKERRASDASPAPAVKIGATSEEDHDSISDHGDDDNHDVEAQFAECPVEGCNETLLATEMAYHIDLHAALDYQESLGVEDERSPSVDADANADITAERATRDSTNVTTMHVRTSKGKGKAGTASSARGKRNRGSSKAAKPPRASSLPPARQPRPASARESLVPQRSSSFRDTTSPNNDEHLYGHRQRGALSHHQSNGHSHQANVSDDTHRSSDDQERHRERRERKRNGGHDGTRDPRHGPRQERRRGSELGLSTLETHDGSHSTFLSRKPSKIIRSWLAYWTGSEAKNRSKIPLSPVKASQSGKAAAVETERRKPERLGKAELGKYADEDRMPDALAVYLKREWGICHRGVIPVLKQLLEQSPTTEYAYLCDPCVQHVSRLPREGGFCGYRNIQTMVSYIVGAKFTGHNLFSEDLPSVFDIQNIIENAWDMGINSQARIETGGIRLTRKYIGTPEAVAMFQSLNIPCNVRAFKHKKPGKSRDLLLRDVEQYFEMGNYQPGRKVRATTLPPIYWQHPGHSLTIVGIEKTKTGDTNLLVFDPIFRDGSAVVRLVGRRRVEHHFPDQLLKPYRRGTKYLSRFRAFEILKLEPRPQDVVQTSTLSLPARDRRQVA